MKVQVINSNFVNSPIVLTFDESKAEFPSIIFSLKDHPCKYYSDALSAECVVVSTTNLSNVVETLKKGCCVIFTKAE